MGSLIYGGLSLPWRELLDTNSPNSRHLRDIENHYHVEMIAENTDQIVRFQAASLRMQAGIAATELKSLQMQREEMERQRARHDDLTREMRAVEAGIESLNETSQATLEAMQAGFESTVDALNAQSEILRQGFETIARDMLEQRKLLEKISRTLERPLETQALELRRQGEKWLHTGAASEKQLAVKYYADAMELFDEVIKNPVGKRDYLTWFRIGWLCWKWRGNLADAEAAFANASRYSAPERNQCYLLSVRHEAYMQDLQGRAEDAFSTIQPVIHHQDQEIGTPFDAARYAWKIGRKADALHLLERCLDANPTTSISMLAEQDFRS